MSGDREPSEEPVDWEAEVAQRLGPTGAEAREKGLREVTRRQGRIIAELGRLLHCSREDHYKLVCIYQRARDELHELRELRKKEQEDRNETDR